MDTGNDGVKRVKYSDLVPLVIEAMKEQESEIVRLKAENKDIKAEAAAIEAENKEIKAKSQAFEARAQETEKRLNLLLKALCEKDQNASFCH